MLSEVLVNHESRVSNINFRVEYIRSHTYSYYVIVCTTLACITRMVYMLYQNNLHKLSDGLLSQCAIKWIY